jgi:ATPase subunit of ABC transporter with duplicated ATPase domains
LLRWPVEGVCLKLTADNTFYFAFLWPKVEQVLASSHSFHSPAGSW